MLNRSLALTWTAHREYPISQIELWQLPGAGGTLRNYRALTRALAVELAPIRVNAVCPGVVRTDLWQSMNADEREHMYESIGKSLLVGRVGEAGEIARVYPFLMQEGYSTGQTVVVDGGAMLM